VDRAGRRLAAFPVDPVGGGTWIGVNDAGGVVAVLSRTAGASPPRTPEIPATTRRSRGLIVRALLVCDSAAHVVEACMEIDAASFAPFRIVAVDRAAVGVVTSDGVSMHPDVSAISGPAVFTSSSLGDALVEGPRRRLFERLVLRAEDAPLDAQARYHRHQWRSKPHLSVCMAREDAATVSRTTVDVTGRGRGLVYESLAGGERQAREWCFFP
jgi:hypothetical protein